MGPLKNSRYEKFAQMVASGLTGSEAYRQVAGATGGKNADVLAARWMDSPGVRERLNELKEGVRRVERAISHLKEGAVGRRGPGRPRKSASGPRRARRRRRNTRADQAVDLISSNPGVTASEMAKQMRIKPNYLYRVLGDLQKEKRVRKDGRKYYPTG